METDAAALKAAGEGAEALTAQLHALRAAQGSEVEVVQAELETERKRAAAEEALQVEMAAEVEAAKAEAKAAEAESAKAKEAAVESARLPRGGRGGGGCA